MSNNRQQFVAATPAVALLWEMMWRCGRRGRSRVGRSLKLEIMLSSQSGTTAFKVHSCELKINRYSDDKLVFAELGEEH